MGNIVGGALDLVGAGPSSKQSKATKAAAKTSADAQKYAADLQKEMFEKQVELQSPFREAGLTAQNRLMQLLGIGPKFDQSFSNFNAGAYLNANPDAKAYVESQTAPTTINPFGIRVPNPRASTKSPEQLAYEHFVADGSRRQGDFWMNTASPDYGKYARDFSMQDFTADPGYAFRLKEGMNALDRQAAARGGLMSGSALKAAQRYGQEMGSQEYGNAFNRYQTNRANQLAPLQSLAGVAQTSANTLGNAAQQYGANAGNLAMAGGANQANALLARGNIAASQYGNYGRALDQALNTDWSKVGSNIRGLFS